LEVFRETLVAEKVGM